MKAVARKAFVLGGNHDQVPYIRELKRRGFNIVLTDRNKNAPAIDLADNFKAIGYDDIDDLLEFSKLTDLCSDDIVFTAAAQFAHRAGARIASLHSIRYPNIEVIEECLDKALFYNAFERSGIPIPPTSYVKNPNEMISAINKHGSEKQFYLKSDMSKNPNYIYTFIGRDADPESVFWGRDRYLNEQYILQEAFDGTCIRLNICGDYFNAYDFNSGRRVSDESLYRYMGPHEIILILKDYLHSKGLSEWLIKFDIIVKDTGWVALDIGIDPPSRMLQSYTELGLDFFAEYIDQYLYADNAFSF